MYNGVFVRQNKNEDKKMGLAKITALLAGTFNVFLYIFAFISNLDNTKSTILFIVALLMSMYRFYRWAITSWQNKRLKDLTIRERELTLIEREQEAKLRDIRISRAAGDEEEPI